MYNSPSAQLLQSVTQSQPENIVWSPENGWVNPNENEDNHNMMCGHCHKTWNDKETPTPSARCPYEYDHDHENDEETNSMSQKFWTRDDLENEYGHRWGYVDGTRECDECGIGGNWWDDSTEVFSPCPSSYFESDDMQNTANLSDWKYFDDMLDMHNGNMYRNETNQLPERFNFHSTHELRSWLANKIVHQSIYGNENN